METISEYFRAIPRKVWVVIAIILVSGLLRLPVESHLLSDLRQRGFHPKHENADAVQQLGVQSLIGVLGGLRYMVATVMELEAVNAWEYQRWDEVEEKYRFVCLLQPRDPESWTLFGWHQAYNASSWYRLNSKDLPEDMREALARQYIERGKQTLREGLAWNPEHEWLYRDLANIYREKDQDYCTAAEIYLQGSKLKNAPSFFYRFYAYLLAQCEGKEEEAYPVLMELYKKGLALPPERRRDVWKPSLIYGIQDLEEKLGVPEADRIPEKVDTRTLRVYTPQL